MSIKKVSITVFADPGHAWGRVRKSVLVALEIDQRISTYSYMRGEYAYLEEDRDLHILIDALKRNGIPFDITERHSNSDSKVRRYDKYKSNATFNQQLDARCEYDWGASL